MNYSSLLTIVFFTFSFFGTLDAQTMAGLTTPALPGQSLRNHPTPISAAGVFNRPVACFPDSNLNFRRFFAKEIEYPELASYNAWEGTVVIRLWVASNGDVSVLGIEQSDCPMLDDTVLEAAAQLPNLLPAVVEGQAVGQSLLIPVKFRLQ